MAGLIANELAQYTPEEAQDGGLHVLFSAHGVPQSYVAAGDPYQRQIQECVRLIGDELNALGWGEVTFTDQAISGRDNKAKRKNYDTYIGDEEDASWRKTTVHLSYQSRVGPVEWLRPYTDDVLEDLGQNQGVRNLVVVPISFVSEHIETLEEIDIEYRELAEENGVTRWRRCPTLNTDARFIEELANLVSDALAEPTLSVSAACIQNNCEPGDFEDSTLRARGFTSAPSVASAAAAAVTRRGSFGKKSLVTRTRAVNGRTMRRSGLVETTRERANVSLEKSPVIWKLPNGGIVRNLEGRQAASENDHTGERVLAIPSPADAKKAQPGLTEDAETWNGRLAMIGITSLALVEIFSGESIRAIIFGS